MTTPTPLDHFKSLLPKASNKDLMRALIKAHKDNTVPCILAVYAEMRRRAPGLTLAQYEAKYGEHGERNDETG